jgi:hypothetical protein
MNNSDQLIGRVIDQIQQDISDQDLAALAELLDTIPTQTLINYLSED